jgi:phosphate butyryltransferase
VNRLKTKKTERQGPGAHGPSSGPDACLLHCKRYRGEPEYFGRGAEGVRTFAELRGRAQELGPKRIGLVVADDETGLRAMEGATESNIAVPVLFGDERRIRSKIEELGARTLLQRAVFAAALDAIAATEAALRMARSHEIDLLLKGHIRTDELLRAVLDKQTGLRTGRLLSDVLLYEDTLAGSRRLVGVTDGGINVAPGCEEKAQIIRNAVAVLHAIGILRPRIALMSATEVVSESVPSTVDAKRLTEMGARGEFGECEVFGPLALDNALLESAAKTKGITSEVAGRADCMVVPNIEAGNLLGKAVKYLGGSQCAHVVMGAKVPILIPSRVESADDKLNSIALGVVASAR